MVPSLGMGVGMGAPTWGDFVAAAVIEDCMWQNYAIGEYAGGYLTPLAQGTVSDFNDIWDLTTIGAASGNYQPQLTSTLTAGLDECFWEVISYVVGETTVIAIQPLDIS